MTKTSAKITSIKPFLLGLMFIGSFGLSQPVRATENGVPVTIPDAPAAIWQMVDKETDEITKMIQTGDIKELHHHAFAIRDLVTALPSHSKSLQPDILAKVESGGKSVAILAKRLDAAGDTNDKGAAESSFEKLKTNLQVIRANYPDSGHNAAPNK